jgi:hypothetical protein
VVKSIHNFLGFTRISENLDINADSLYVYTITFSGNFFETFEDPIYNIPMGGTSGLSWTFDGGLSQDSNNDNIFTGFASSSGLF